MKYIEIFLSFIGGLLIAAFLFTNIVYKYSDKDVTEIQKEYKAIEQKLNSKQAELNNISDEYNQVSINLKSAYTDIQKDSTLQDKHYILQIKMYAYKYTKPEIEIETTRDVYYKVKIGEEITESTYPLRALKNNGWVINKFIR